MKKIRTTHTLRNMLFDEIEALRAGEGDASRALAVANLAKQIINIAKVELEFHRQAMKQAEAGMALQLGSMQLGGEIVDPIEGQAARSDPRPNERDVNQANSDSSPV